MDPAWDVASLLDLAAADGYRVTGALVTHYHPDHVGGDLFGRPVQGLAKLLERAAVPIYVNKHEADGVRWSRASPRPTSSGSTMAIPCRWVLRRCASSTPRVTLRAASGFLVGNRLVAGDTLFVQGCGRVDLPGGDPEAMYHTLTGKLAKLPRETVLYPGHNYGPTSTSTIGDELQNNQYMRIRSLADWRRLMG